VAWFTALLACGAVLVYPGVCPGSGGVRRRLEAGRRRSWICNVGFPTPETGGRSSEEHLSEAFLRGSSQPRLLTAPGFPPGTVFGEEGVCKRCPASFPRSTVSVPPLCQHRCFLGCPDVFHPPPPSHGLRLLTPSLCPPQGGWKIAPMGLWAELSIAQ